MRHPAPALAIELPADASSAVVFFDQQRRRAFMTPPIVHAASKVALIIALCIGFIGGALLFSHAHFYRAQQRTDTPPVYESDLPPVW
jgi:hypothetical protein